MRAKEVPKIVYFINFIIHVQNTESVKGLVLASDVDGLLGAFCLVYKSTALKQKSHIYLHVNTYWYMIFSPDKNTQVTLKSLKFTRLTRVFKNPKIGRGNKAQSL